MTNVNTSEVIKQSHINPIGDVILNNNYQVMQKRLNEASEKDHLKQERENLDKFKADISKRMADLKTKEESLLAKENSITSREIALDSNEKFLQQKITKHKNEKRKDEQDAKKQINDRNKISEDLNKRSRSLNQRSEDLNKRSRSLDIREQRLESREVIAKQNSLAVQLLERKLTEIESRLTEGFSLMDEKIDTINAPQKRKRSKEKSNGNQIDFLSDKRNISLPEDYVFVLQNGEELGQCENLQSFISGIGRAKITGNIDDFLADFNFYFNDEGEPFLEVNIAELHENTQKDLCESFLNNT